MAALKPTIDIEQLFLLHSHFKVHVLFCKELDLIRSIFPVIESHMSMYKLQSEKVFLSSNEDEKPSIIPMRVVCFSRMKLENIEKSD